MTDDELDHFPFTVGKYRGKTPSDVAMIDPIYIVWAYENWEDKPCSKLLYNDCLQDMHQHRRH